MPFELDLDPNDPNPLGDAGAKLAVHVEASVCLRECEFLCDSFKYNLKYAPVKYQV